jgi:hypothetical protein
MPRPKKIQETTAPEAVQDVPDNQTDIVTASEEVIAYGPGQKPPMLKPPKGEKHVDGPNFLWDLFLLQKELDGVKFIKGATGSTGKRDYSYQDLPSLQEASKPVLRKHNFMWFTKPSSDVAGNPTLVYTLLHVSGKDISGEVPLPKNIGAQDMGGAITYFRRYTLSAVLDIAAEDDDGKQAQVASTIAETPANPGDKEKQKYIQYIEAISSKLEIDKDPSIYEMTMPELIKLAQQLKAQLDAA